MITWREDTAGDDELLDPSYGTAVLDVAAEVAESFNPWHDDEMCVWSFVVEWKQRLEERGVKVPRKLAKLFRAFERRREEGENTARNLTALVQDIPPEKQAAAYIQILEGYERLFRDRGLIVPMWVGVARAWFIPPDSTYWNEDDKPD